MAAAYSWHPGSHAVGAQWPLPTPLLPDEILSSWLVRAALKQGCSPMTLAATLWTDWRMWTIDTDRNLSSGRLKVLSLRSGIREDFIRAATLAPTIGKTQHRPLSKNITWPWTLTIGARNTKRRNGLQYCPLCLTGDASPYFRINWRFAWHTGCERHQCALLDRCWYCQSPVEPHRLTELSSSAAVCSSCNKALAEGPQSKGCPYALAFQQACDQVLTTGFFKQPIGEGTLVEWFPLANFFVTLIRRTACTQTEAQISLFNLLNIELPPGFPIALGTNKEWLSVKHRQVLFNTAWQLMITDREDFRSKLLESGISKQGFAEQIDFVPPALQELLDLLPDARHKQRKPRRSKKPGPRPRREVERMMARLQKRLAMRQQ